ncbi:hypothetical protein H2203_003576 [Taxawa tesnikishii (nom. ined.)]|nr:hypothetical protein H2203_003576 [Dothideales sp. JES 119]
MATTGQDPDQTSPVAIKMPELSALRLNVQRCIISLLGKDYEYVLAESTKTLSLQSDAVHGATDALWLGTTKFPRDQGIGHICLDRWRRSRGQRQVPEDTDHYYTDGASPFWYIISDLRQRPELAEQPFIKHAKGLRFYCAVPIRSPSGSVLGSYAVLDDKPRYGISAAEMEFMEDVADTIFGHLEMKRAMIQRKRGDRLIKGLALFNGGKSSLREWWLANYSRQDRGEGQRRRRRSSTEEETRQERADEEFGQTYRSEELDVRGRLQTKPNESGTVPAPPVIFSSAPSAIRDERPRDKSSHDRPNTGSEKRSVDTTNHAHQPTAAGHFTQKKVEGFDLARETKHVYARATNLLRESMNAEGVLIMDADFSHSTEGRKRRYKEGEQESEEATTSTSETSSSSEEDLEGGGSETARGESRTSQHSGINLDPNCSLLGFSTKIKSSVRGFSPSRKHSSLPKTVLDRLLRRYPQGKIFSYYEGGNLSSSSGGEGSAFDMSEATRLHAANVRRKWKSKESRDSTALAELINEPRSVAFIPLWDSNRDRWRSAVFIWNCFPNRFLDIEEDLTYMSAFGNSLMAELARLDAFAADQAKAAFISSVSHELRSPLHGVLVGAEFLHESNLDPYQKEMATAVSMAGKTLLDTINNILDFTKINSFTDVQRRDRRDRDTKRNITFKGADLQEVGVTSSVDLAVLTENVVDTVVTATQFKALEKPGPERARPSLRSISSSSDESSPEDEVQEADPVVVMFEVFPRRSWRVSMSPGSWTRIITNLLGNAFKYTKTGRIEVKLYSKQSKKSGDHTVFLTIEDTGQGISLDYLTHSLYTPFMQENSHAVGTGLGLSIVKQIVDDIGGKIDIESEVGRGTKVTVSLPVPEFQEIASDFESIQVPKQLGRAVKVGFLTPKGKSETQRRERQLLSMATKVCEGWLNCPCSSVTVPPATIPPDVCIMTEEDFSNWSERESDDLRKIDRANQPAIIVLSSAIHSIARRSAEANASRG